MRNFKLFYVVDDGITTLRCGVGAIAVNFVRAFTHIFDYFIQRGIRLQLSIISFKSASNAINRRDDLYKYTQRVCCSTGGRVYLIAPKYKSKKAYFDFKFWKNCNRKVSEIINKNSKFGNTQSIVLANDTIFSHLKCKKGIIQVWIPHSFSFIHSQTYIDNRTRLLWEREAIEYHRHYKHGFIGYISPFVKQTLINTFDLQENKLLPFLNGFCISFIRKQYNYSQKTIKKVLLSRKIPINKPLIFAFARSDEYKGLETSLQVMMKFTKKHQYHGVLIASRFNNEEIVDRVQKRLRDLLRGHSCDINLFFGYEFELPKYLLRNPLTGILLHLPNRDFCPLIPFEAEIIGHSRLCIVNSNLDCFRGLIKDCKDGFLVSPTFPQSFNDINSIMRISVKKQKEIIRQGRKRTRRLFNIRKNYINGLEHLLNEAQI